MTSQDIVDNSAMEEKLDEENESIAMKNDVRMDECSSEDGLNPPIEDDGVSQSVPVDSISEELVNDDRDVSAVEGSDNGDVQKGKVELENDVKQNVGDGRTPQTGMIFKSYEEVVNFYKRYALRIGFGVAVKKSSFNTYGLCRRLVLVCTRGGKGRANECYQSRPTAKTDCPATVVAKLWGDGLLHLMEVNLEHNHPLNQVYEVPSQYILDRWRRDFKQLHILAHRAKDVLGNTILERYDNLSLRYLQLVEIGAMSDEKFQLALRLIKEMEMSLLDDNTFRDLKSRLLVPDRSNGSDELTQMGFFEGSRTPSVPAKRRGRPPKKLKESNIETLSTSVNNKDTSTSLLVGSQNDTLQTVSTISQLGSHIRMPGGVDLMEEVNPNELSFGNQFGVHPNPQHHVGNQSVIQPSNTIQFGQQPVGNQSRMQWFYQEMLQEDQTPYVRRPG
ncbi:uncharacterized protein A4U43_C06F2200 [Asparagus officinalis]|uniref:Protein FAR1-RELATED SEQUENCE n=1 Tax=Asparagus officinalis TaxID=4686 RepID=A0A5P1EL29_ASPOF|nr:uncharacterized protein A4U43_C06F2200 [Asparagus officinalis]